jgi:hypothetical protein
VIVVGEWRRLVFAGDSVSAARAAEADCGRLREIAPVGGGLI